MKYGNIKNALRNGLVGKSLLWRLDKLGLKLEPYYVFQEGYFGVPEGDWDSQFSRYQTEFVGTECMREVASCESFLSEALLIERLNNGQRCFAVKDQGRIAAYTWCDFTEFNHAPCRFKLGSNEAYLYNAYTLPAYRGKSLAPFMRYRCYQALSGLGKEVFYSYSEYFNTPAIRFKKKLNARFLKLCLYVSLGGWYSWNWTLREYQKPLSSSTVE